MVLWPAPTFFGSNYSPGVPRTPLPTPTTDPASRSHTRSSGGFAGRSPSREKTTGDESASAGQPPLAFARLHSPAVERAGARSFERGRVGRGKVIRLPGLVRRASYLNAGRRVRIAGGGRLRIRTAEHRSVIPLAEGFSPPVSLRIARWFWAQCPALSSRYAGARGGKNRLRAASGSSLILQNGNLVAGIPTS